MYNHFHVCLIQKMFFIQSFICYIKTFQKRNQLFSKYINAIIEIQQNRKQTLRQESKKHTLYFKKVFDNSHKMSLNSQKMQQSTQANRTSSHQTVQSQNTPKKSKNGIELMKNYLIKKAENMYKLNLSDEQAFKWKFNKDKNNRPLSSFRLIRKQSLFNVKDNQLEQLKDYSFPVLSKKTKQLAQLSILMLRQNEYFKGRFNNDQEYLKRLVVQISVNYNIVSYHNFSHAFSLTLMLFQSFEYHPQMMKIYSQEDRFYAMLAGLAHDMNHPGTNNAFEVKTKSPRAIEFNNLSVLQNFHLKQFWRLLQNHQQINFLNKIPNPQQVKKKITYLILMTDVAQHFKNLQKLKQMRQQAQNSSTSLFSTEQNKQFFMGQLFHACDIGNPCIDFQNYISWAALLSYEFNQQTKLQKQNQVEITEMLRYKDLQTFYKGQLGFINFMVFPLWKEIAEVCGGLKIFRDIVLENKEILNIKIQEVAKEDETKQVKY